AIDNSVHVVVLRGDGPMFSSGMDVSSLADLSDQPENLRPFRHGIIQAWNLLEEMAKPTICQIHGACIGGAMELALACDMRVMDSAAKPALAVTLEQEVTAQEILASSDDFAEGTRAFKEKRDPEFAGR